MPTQRGKARSKRIISAVLLAGIFALSVASPFNQAEAVVPTFDVALNPLLEVTQPAIVKNTSALVAKEYTFDPIAWVLKLVIRTARDVIIRWIITGQLGFPTFSQSFTLDAQDAATVAARLFLSRLSGINFCEGIPPIPPQAFASIDLNAALECRFEGDLGAFRNGDVFTYDLLLQSSFDQNNYWSLAMAALKKKVEAEVTAETAFTNEFLSGQGFLGVRDQATGKVKTPGRIVAGTLLENVSSLFREYDVADELEEAVTAIVDTFLWKIVNEGLSEISD